MEFLTNGPENSDWRIVLAHGAGAAMDSAFMERLANGLGERGYRVVRFEFPYMAERRQTGKKKPPDPHKKLLGTWDEVIRDMPSGCHLVTGGKSMGGRMAVMAAPTYNVAGVMVFGYPFHPPGKPDQLRLAPLQELNCPHLVVQGERDALGSRDEIEGWGLPSLTEIVYVRDGDHSFNPRKRSGGSWEDNMANALKSAGDFLERLEEH